MSSNAVATITAAVGEWTPQHLITVFLREELRCGFPPAGRRERERCDWHAGFCANLGRSAYAPGIDGFDDGHALWGELVASGWELIETPARCEFPLTFSLTWRPREGEQPYASLALAGLRAIDPDEPLSDPSETPDRAWCIASYCEGDFGIAIYDDETAYRHAERKLREQ